MWIDASLVTYHIICRYDVERQALMIGGVLPCHHRQQGRRGGEGRGVGDCRGGGKPGETMEEQRQVETKRKDTT